MVQFFLPLLNWFLHVVRSAKGSVPGGWNGGRVLWISSDRDYRMGPKIKTQKVLTASNKTRKKSLDQKLTPKKSHAEFL